MGIYYLSLDSSRIGNSSRAWQAACDAGVTAWVKTSEFVLSLTVSTDKGPMARAYKLQWRNKTDYPSGSWTDVGTGDIVAGTCLTDDNPVTSGEASGCPGGESTWQDGLENAGDNLLPDSGTFSLADNCFSEFHWALDPSNGLGGKEYEFQLYDVTQGAAVAVAVATTTLEVETIDVSDVVGLSDAVFVHKVLVLGDAVGLSDVATRPLKTLVLTDGVSLADAPLVDKTLILSDGVALGDVPFVDKVLTLTDAVNLSDVPSRPFRVLVLEDGVGLSDVPLIDKVLLLTDGVSLADVPFVDKSFVLTDTLSLSDEAFADKILVVTDGLQLVDAIFLRILINFAFS